MRREFGLGTASYIGPGVAVTVLVVVAVDVKVEVVHLLGLAARPCTAWLVASNARANLTNIVNGIYQGDREILQHTSKKTKKLLAGLYSFDKYMSVPNI